MALIDTTKTERFSAFKLAECCHVVRKPDYEFLAIERDRLVEELRLALEEFVDLNEYWNGGNGAAVDACQHTCEVSEKAIDKIRATLGVE